jgi:hypothetical protein
MADEVKPLGKEKKKEKFVYEFWRGSAAASVWLNKDPESAFLCTLANMAALGGRSVACTRNEDSKL